jgi:predicted deacylase
VSQPRASKQTGFLTCPAPDGSAVRIPFASARGQQDGPTLLAVAGVHGCEFVGIEAVTRLHSTLDVADLTGTLLTVPCFGIPAFYGLTAHVSPLDGLDPGRVFPGDPAGSHTERAADLVWRQLALRADAVLDVHGGDLEEDYAIYAQVDLTGDAEVDARSEALARAFGFPLLLEDPPVDPPRARWSLHRVAAEHGIPSVLTEVGGHGVLDPALVERYLVGLRGAMRELGMLPGRAQEAPPEPRVLHGFFAVTAPVEGTWHPVVVAGEDVRSGELLGEVRDHFGVTLTDVTAAQDGVVLGVVTSCGRRVGDLLATYACIDPGTR